jgi:putative transposase
MTFIRAKEIPPRSGNWYDYEVMTVHEGDRVRQKVIRYLGRSGSRPLPLRHSLIKPSLSPMDNSLIPANQTRNNARIHKMKTPAKQIASALGMYYSGMSLDGVQQQFKQVYGLDMSESNYWNWVQRFTKEAIKEARNFKPIVGDRWVADETYMKLGKRNVYFWDIMDTHTRYLLASHVSFTRTGRDAKALMDLAQKRAGKSPRVVVTDKLAAYIMAVEDTFGADSKHRRGGPFYSVEDSTSQIERFHRTLEQRTKIFQKYKDIDDIRLLTDGWLINYNFFKQNEGCGNIPPAQAMSKVVPFKDWNDIVRPEGIPDLDYQVTLRRRESVKKGKPVLDARLTPIEAAHGGSA